MIKKYEMLISPIKVGQHIYKNRMIASPIYCGPFVKIPPLKKMFFHEFGGRAAGGYAQVTIGETAVDFEYASREPFPPIDYTNLEDPAAADLKIVVDDIKKHGGKAMIELSHCGESMLKLPGLPEPIGPTGFLREDGTTVIDSYCTIPSWNKRDIVKGSHPNRFWNLQRHLNLSIKMQTNGVLTVTVLL